MTEEEWLASDDLSALLRHLQGLGEPWLRPVRLFVVACCLQVAHLTDDPEIGGAIAAAERHARGRITRATLQGWVRRCRLARRQLSAAAPPLARLVCDAVVTTCWHVQANRGYRFGTRRILGVLMTEARQKGKANHTELAAHLLALLRDTVGNPFRPRPACQPAWLEANGGLAGRLARGIHEERKFAELPILADALEDAGCPEAELLEHLRGPGPHERGCWALEVLLGPG